MARSEIQQARNLLTAASSLLLVTPPKASLDAIAAMISLALFLDQNTKERPLRLDPVSPAHVPAALQFLPGSSQVKTEPARQTEIIVDIAGPAAITDIRREQLTGGTRLRLAVADTALTREQVEVAVRRLPYDSVVIIGAADLEELGPTFTEHTDFFYSTPSLNIDHRAANEHFGTVNLVDITAGSVAEVMHELITNFPQSLTPNVATALYAGIVAGTDSFQKPSTTPRSFQVAAQLIEQQADRETVIQHLVKTKPLKLIKLLGSLYARLRCEESVGLYWTSLEASDFLESRASAEDIPAVMHELSNNIAGFTAAFLLYQTSTDSPQYFAYLMLGRGLKQRRREIQEVLGAAKENSALTFTITAPSLEAAEKTAHDKMRQILP